MLSYWKTKEQLLAFASNREATHLPAWKAFQKAIGTGGDVGVWHETYVVSSGSYENVYVNMPPFGLGAVAGLVEATGGYARAARRLGAGTPVAAEVG
jgi:hypothetical protein